MRLKRGLFYGSLGGKQRDHNGRNGDLEGIEGFLGVGERRGGCATTEREDARRINMRFETRARELGGSLGQSPVWGKLEALSQMREKMVQMVWPGLA